MDKHKPNKKLSCQRCRLKKIKCNYEYPCHACLKGKQECVQITNDMRKKRPTVNYVESLERKYSEMLQIMKSFDGFESIEEKSTYLNSINLDTFIDGNVIENDYTRNDTNDENDVSVYGPISIFDNATNANHDSKNSQLIQTDEYRYIKQLNNDPDILHCIKLFFVWQYPDLNMFIFREAFLSEFFKPKYYNLYCSKTLILSISALGARMSDNETIYLKSVSYYNEAKNLLLNKLNTPSITALQSFLLLSFYDIFNGSNSSGWMLSGNAIRMGYDLGFQLHPNSWFLKQRVSNYSKEIDNEIKSRIYWGTYLADHFISLLLGRPSLLKLNDATIPETDDLPELQWIDEYRYLDDSESKKRKKVSNISSPLKNVINLINISENMLNDIFNKNFNQDFNKDSKSLVSTLVKLNEYNEKILNWKMNLPEDLKFNKESLMQTADNPTLGCIRYYYYILLLCLNRPFIGLNDEYFTKPALNPKLICLEAIDDLYVAINKFKSVHGLKKSSIFIIYCSILSLSIILLLKSSNLIKNEVKKLKFFLYVLNQSSRTWKLAEKSLHSITSSLSSFEDLNFKVADLQDEEPDFNDVLVPINNRSRSGTPKLDPRLDSKLEPKDIDMDISESLVSEQARPIMNSINSLNSLNSNTSDASNELEFFGGPPVLMTSDLFNQDWESLFPDYMFNDKS